MDEEDRTPDTEPAADDGASQAVWSYRGYQLRPSDFTTAMVHFFRAEISRANVWRQRLDMTTNWAVITTGAAISFAFTGLQRDHSVIILNTLLVTLFLSIEARRYRSYELWSYRVRLMETDFFAAMLVSPFRPAPDWAETLAESLLMPQFPISVWEAVGRRFRRNYMWIYMILGLAWLLNVSLHPTAARSWREVVDRAAIGGVPGEWVIALGVLFNGGLLLIGVLTIGLSEATGEVLPRYRFLGRGEAEVAPARPAVGRAWFRPSSRRVQLMTLIVTDRGEAVAKRILDEMYRGVTAMPGTGMYTGHAHSVLMCALTVTEVTQLEVLVKSEDPQAFVMVLPVHEVLGEGFASLDEAGAGGPRASRT